MNEVKIVLNQFILKIIMTDIVKSPTKLIRVLADAGLDVIREKCSDENTSFTERF